MSQPGPDEPLREPADLVIEHIRPYLVPNAWRETVRATTPEVQALLANFKLIRSTNEPTSSDCP